MDGDTKSSQMFCCQNSSPATYQNRSENHPSVPERTRATLRSNQGQPSQLSRETLRTTSSITKGWTFKIRLDGF